MKKYMMVTPETLSNLAKCFANSEEISTFISQMDGLIDEMTFSAMMRNRIHEEQAAVVLLKQVCVFTLFCREHMDLIHQLISKLECKEITEEEMKEMQE